MTFRKLHHLIPSIAASDGAGVKLRRSIGSNQRIRVDPFLMLDEFFSDDPNDYLAGFPSHPHRGFETVTYMLDGHMLHEDHMGNRGNLGPGDVQWMSAAHGIIHSEMPQQTEGRMRGFQLWINLPAAEKMKPASYRDIPAKDIPEVNFGNGGKVRIIAGNFLSGETITTGAMRGLTTEPIYFDVHLAAGEIFTHPLPPQHNAFIYVYEGGLTLGDQPLPQRAAGVLGAGDAVQVTAGDTECRFLLLAAKPLNEPIVQYGPFVMNTQAEIEQALADYRAGTLAV